MDVGGRHEMPRFRDKDIIFMGISSSMSCLFVLISFCPLKFHGGNTKGFSSGECYPRSRFVS